MLQLDATHDPSGRSRVPGANGHSEFPIQNLPLGVFSLRGGDPRGGVAIGDAILDLRAALAEGLLTSEAARAAEAARGPDLNELFSLGERPRRALRSRLSQLLSNDSSEMSKVELCLVQTSQCTLHLPSRIGDYTDSASTTRQISENSFVPTIRCSRTTNTFRSAITAALPA